MAQLYCCVVLPISTNVLTGMGGKGEGINCRTRQNITFYSGGGNTN